MDKGHPSGRPIRQVKRGIPAKLNWPRDEMVVPRLNHPTRELVGGFGFAVPPEPEDAMTFETRTKRRR